MLNFIWFIGDFDIWFVECCYKVIVIIIVLNEEWYEMCFEKGMGFVR